jgi:DNA polymerase III epsilon subunit-like protein
VAFLNAELTRIGRPRWMTVCRVTDTLMLARELHPGKKNSLDALCERYASTIRAARCTGRCSMRSCSPTSGSR